MSKGYEQADIEAAQENFNTQQLSISLKLIMFLLGIVILGFLIPPVFFWDEQTPGERLGTLIAVAVCALLIGLTYYLLRRIRIKSIRQAAALRKELASGIPRTRWAHNRKVLPVWVLVFFLSPPIGLLFVDLTAAAYTFGFIFILLLIAVLIERTRLRGIDITPEALIITKMSEKTISVPRAELRKVRLGAQRIQTKHASSWRQELSIVGDDSQVFVAFTDIFDWPLHVIAQRISEFYEIPLESEF